MIHGLRIKFKDASPHYESSVYLEYYLIRREVLVLSQHKTTPETQYHPRSLSHLSQTMREYRVGERHKASSTTLKRVMPER